MCLNFVGQPLKRDYITGVDKIDTDELLAQLHHHRQVYYNNAPGKAISDAAYDAIEAELIARSASDPTIKESLSDVGASTISNLFTSVIHAEKMLSLDKVYELEELRDWTEGYQAKQFVLWPKFDGVSLSLVYEQGRLVRAATRGDGSQGEDITANTHMVANLPRTLASTFSGEVRGEVVMHLSDFKKWNTNNPDKAFANPRNAVSGSLRLKDSRKGPSRKMHFYPFDIVEADNLAQTLRQIGFTVVGGESATMFEEIENYINKIVTERASLEFEIDGVVVRLADYQEYQKAGVTSHHPKGALAFKMAAEIVETDLLEVQWQVGKSGMVSPRGRLAPIFVAGATIEYVSLHNLSVISERNIRLGQKVLLRRSGEVIPQVLGPAPGQTGGKIIKPPSCCPSCGGSIVEEGQSKLLRCLNNQCPAQLQRRIEHWCSREASDIDALGARWIERLIEHKLVSSISDLYNLCEEDLLPNGEPLFPGLGQKSARRLLESIGASRQVGLRRTLIGFSIPLASAGTAKRLCLFGFETIESIQAASESELASVDDVGPLVAASLRETLNREDVKKEIAELRKAGVSLDRRDSDAPQSGSLQNKRIVLTGSLSVNRKEFASLLEAAGAHVSGSVSVKTDWLVCGDGGGSKKQKAEKLGVSIIDETQARALLSQ